MRDARPYCNIHDICIYEDHNPSNCLGFNQKMPILYIPSPTERFLLHPLFSSPCQTPTCMDSHTVSRWTRSRSRSRSPTHWQWRRSRSPNQLDLIPNNSFRDSNSLNTTNSELSLTRAPTLSIPFSGISQAPTPPTNPATQLEEPVDLNFHVDATDHSRSPKRWTPRSRSPITTPNRTPRSCPSPSSSIPSLPEPCNPSPTHSLPTPTTVRERSDAWPRVMFPFSSFDKAPPPMCGGGVHRSEVKTEEEVELEVMEMGRTVEEERSRGERAWSEAGGERKVEGVFLTWEDLWVTAAAASGGGRTAILRGINGFARPGEVLAIMGPSGCGKSTLLDTLAGRLQFNVKQSGQILVNGRRQKLSFGTSAYVTQDDVLMTTLTVREAIYYSAEMQLPNSMSRSVKHKRADETIREMGLRAVVETRIGGWASKGLSGGQKRRLSICIEILTRPQLLFLDEPTSGLDSAASYHVMSRIVGLARREGMTLVVAIHQPSSEVFELFHGLCLLAYGQTMWFGPRSMTSEFFALNGFPCPAMMNPSDHYLRTINKDFDVDIEEGLDVQPTTVTEVIETLIQSYKSSLASQLVSSQIVEICKKGGVLVKKENQASFFTQSLVLIRRSFVNMYRDLGYYWLRLGIYIMLCLCVGTIYYDISFTIGSIQARGSMLMFVAAFLTFMAIGGFPSFVEDMKIFGRERLSGHYGVTAFVIGNTVSSIPYLVLISVIPGAIAYYLVGLQRGIEHFTYFVLVLFMCMMLVEGLMMIVASIVPDFLMGIITGAGIQGVMMLNGGFFRLPNDLPNPIWRYPMYYIAFHKYANQGFYKNEFIGLNFSNNISGEEVLKNTWQVEVGYSKWIDLSILFGMVIIYRLLFFIIIKTTEKAKSQFWRLLKGTTDHDHVVKTI